MRREDHLVAWAELDVAAYGVEHDLADDGGADGGQVVRLLRSGWMFTLCNSRCLMSLPRVRRPMYRITGHYHGLGLALVAG